MEELLDQLIKKAANETEEAHRHYIAALNGLAGELRRAPEGILCPGSGVFLTPWIRDG
jgi:hypothetical protein